MDMVKPQQGGWYSGIAEALLDWPAGRLVALTRAVLALFALAAIYIDPTQPARNSAVTYLLLTAYLVYAGAVMMANQAERLTGPAARLALHHIDIAAFAVLMHLTEGPTSPFFVFFTFSLLAATLQWRWRGALATAGLLIVLLLGLAGADALIAEPGESRVELNRLVIRSAYLLVAGTMLAYVGAFQERHRRRLATLTDWPAEEASLEAEYPRLERALGHAAGILQARRILVVWEEIDEPHVFWAVWEAGTCGYGRDKAGHFGPLVATHLADQAFASEEIPAMPIGEGESGEGKPSGLVSEVLAARFTINHMATAPMTGNGFAGRIFVLDPLRRDRPDLLALTRLVAARIGISLDHHALQGELQRAAVTRERARLARDMHDGVLQALTAIALQLKSMAAAVPPASAQRLKELRATLADQQQRIRAFVRLQRADAELAAEFRLAEAAELLLQAGRQWGVEATLNVDPHNATVPRDLGYHICLIITEAIANAARHGGAHRFGVEMQRRPGTVSISTHASGKPIPGITGTFDQDALAEMQLGPRSIIERVRELRGTLDLTSDEEGVRLHMTLPAP